MNELDDIILEFMEELGEPGGEPVVLSPTQLWYNIAEKRSITDKTANTVSRRMSNLADHGLLERVEDGKAYYILTEKGRAYLAGELDAEDLESDEET
jgi:DNA-binding transcriptional ArsR family regulator